VIYPLKTSIYALVGISERTFKISYKGVKYAHIKIPARTFHSFVSFAHKHWCTLAIFFKLWNAVWQFDFDEKHNYTLKVFFVEHHTPFNVYVSHRRKIQFEDEVLAVYTSFRWVTTACLRWKPQPMTLYLYPVKTE